MDILNIPSAIFIAFEARYLLVPSQSPVAESSDDRVSKEHKSPPSNIAMAQRPYPVETSFKLPLPDSLTSLLDRQTYGTLAMQPGEQCIPPDKTHSLQVGMCLSVGMC